MALTDKLSAIGDAIRSKSGTTALMTLDEMPAAIEAIETGGGADLPAEAYLITGDCQYRFASGGWDWFIELYGDKITTENISNAGHMFYYGKITELPFELNFIDGGCDCKNMYNCSNIETIPPIDFKQTSYKDCAGVFQDCSNLKEIGTIKNLYPSNMGDFFNGCENLRYLPEFENLNLNRIYTYANCDMANMFDGCFSLRSIPEDFLKQFYQPLLTGYYYSVLYSAFNYCFALDEVRGLNPQTGTMTSNLFYNTFNSCHRLKEVIFATQEDGTPYSVNWKSQTIDLSKEVGYEKHVGAYYNILHYNAGLGPTTQVFEDTTYQERKNHPDWWTGYVTYSRYNRTSAVNTINSLPDTSAYLAANGGTNTIKFYGAAGASTDGGAINTLTEEEIAVATAKGWTVSFA